MSMHRLHCKGNSVDNFCALSISRSFCQATPHTGGRITPHISFSFQPWPHCQEHRSWVSSLVWKIKRGGGYEPSPLSHTLLSSFKAAGLYWDNHTTDIRHSSRQAEQLVILHRREHLALATFYLCGNPEQPCSETHTHSEFLFVIGFSSQTDPHLHKAKLQKQCPRNPPHCPSWWETQGHLLVLTHVGAWLGLLIFNMCMFCSTMT